MHGMSKVFHAMTSVFPNKNSMRDASSSSGSPTAMGTTLLGYPGSIQIALVSPTGLMELTVFSLLLYEASSFS
jgi:hypothetical protein